MLPSLFLYDTCCAVIESDAIIVVPCNPLSERSTALLSKVWETSFLLKVPVVWGGVLAHHSLATIVSFYVWVCMGVTGFDIVRTHPPLQGIMPASH